MKNALKRQARFLEKFITDLVMGSRNSVSVLICENLRPMKKGEHS